jgi:hypothetical protein
MAESIPVLPISWVEVLGKMERAVEHWLPTLHEMSRESSIFSSSPACPLPLPNVKGLEAAARAAAELADDADASARVAADDLDRWLAECDAAAQTLAVSRERAVG